MIGRPAFPSYYRVEVVEGEGVYLLSEWSRLVLKGALYCRLAPLLDGSRTADEIVDELASRHAPAHVYYALARMEQRGFVVEADPGLPAAQAAFWQAAGLDPRAAARRLAETPVSVTGIAGVPTEPLRRQLGGAGCRVVEDGASFDVVATDEYLREELAERNARALAEERPWLLVKPVGAIVWIGPVFRPGAGPCWACLAHKLRQNREVDGYLLSRNGSMGPLVTSMAALAPTVETAAALAASSALLAIARGASASDELTAFDVLAQRGEPHVVVRRPQCPSCGDGSLRPDRRPAPITLEGAPTRFSDDGGHRTVSPQETYERYRHHVSPISGAVTTLEPVRGGVGEVAPVYVAGHNFAMRRDSLHHLRRGLRSKSAGKGVSEAQARASALCEAIERYSGLFQGYEPRRSARVTELGDEAIEPNACMRFSDRQFAERERWNAQDSQFQIIPAPLDAEAELEWSPAWSLTAERFRTLPTSYLYFGYPHDPDAFYCWPDSNGNAAGNTREEAILQGFFELVERDAVCIWWYNRLRRPALDLDSFADPWLDRMRARYAELSRELWALDLTHDLGIPAFAAVTRRTDKPVEDILLAFGAHFDPAVALRRAMCELNQFMPAVLPLRADGSGDYAYHDAEAIRWWKTATVAREPYLLPAPDEAARTRSEFVDRSTGDIRDDVLACRELVERQGMEFLVLDQTRPDIGMPVTKVLVPGMRHFWARFGPGRLYDVPLAMGWLDRPPVESELNPIPMFV